MLHIYTEGQEIALPSDISFSYNIENPFVTEAEGYSMSIEVPLTAVENLSIFGMIMRMDADLTQIRFDAQLVSPQYSACGVLAIVGITEATVKLQFLQGRSAANFDARLDRTYINELDLGCSPLSYTARQVTPSSALKSIDEGGVAVALPWVMTSSGEVIHNRMLKSTQDNTLMWHSDTKDLSYMPYLIVVARRICEAAGYTCDFSQWETSVKRFLIVCNAMPESLQLKNFSHPLPHWTVSEFFENIEFLLEGRFEIDNVTKHISFTRNSTILSDAGTVVPENIVDEFSATLEADPDNAQRPEFLRNRGYDSNSGRFWNLRNCDWYIRALMNGVADDSPSSASATHSGAGSRGPVGPSPGWYYDTMPDTGETYKTIRRFDTLDDLIAYASQFKFSTNLPGFGGDALFYAADCRCFFCLNAVRIIPFADIPSDFRQKYSLVDAGIYYHNFLYPVNDFGDYILDDSDDADRKDLKVVPVDLDIAQGLCCFLPFSEAGESVADDEVRQPKSFSLILAGKRERPQYYDRLHVAYWDGLRPSYVEGGVYPLTSNVTIYTGWKYEISPQGQHMRLNNGFIYCSKEMMGVDFNKTYKISFLSDHIPEVAAIFMIRGKRYVCRKLTVEFTREGMSPLVKGEFYRLG